MTANFNMVFTQASRRTVARQMPMPRRLTKVLRLTTTYAFGGFTNFRLASALLRPCSRHMTMACFHKSAGRGR
jgi:hypothetical protein